MRRFVLLLLLLPALACAAPDRAGLIHAWETSMRSDGVLDAQTDGSYHYRNEAIGYDGNVKLLTAIVNKDGPGVGMVKGMGARGSVDFDLPDLPASAARSESVGLLSWKAERQNFVYDDTKQTWLSMTEWAKARYHGDANGGITSWLLDYAVPIGVLALLVAVFWGVARVQRRANKQLGASDEITRRSRENIERAAELQEAQRARMQESIELARRNTATLEAILEELRRRPLG